MIIDSENSETKRFINVLETSQSIKRKKKK